MLSPAPLECIEVLVPATLAAQLPVITATDPTAIADVRQASFVTLGRFMERNQLTASGPPRAIYATWGGATTSFTLAFPVAAAPAVTAPVRDCAIGTLAGGRMLRFVHRGSSDQLPHTYARIDEWLRARGDVRSEADWLQYAGMWEEYTNRPGEVPDDELLTNVYLPL